MLSRFRSFQKRFGCNFKGIRLTTTRFIACSCIRPPLLVTSLPQNINACKHHVASVDRSVEWQFCLTKHKLYIVTILKCRVFILFSFSLTFVVEGVACSWSNSRWNGVDFTKHLYGHHASCRISRSKSSKLNSVSLQDAGGIHCYHFRIHSFYSSLCFALILWS